MVQIQNQIKSHILNTIELEGIMAALEIQYGKTIPLYHATSPENFEKIRKVGLKMSFGKNALHFGKSEQLYFQIGKSDYVDSHRSVLIRFDVSLDFFEKYACADLDNVTITEKDLQDLNIDTDSICSEAKDFIKYFVWNGMKLEGMEIMLVDIDGEGIGGLWGERVI